MSNAMTPDTTLDEDAEVKAAIEQMLVEVRRMNKQMEHDQEEIEQLKARNRARLAEVRAQLGMA